MNQSDLTDFSALMRSEAELYPNAAATTPIRIQAYFESLERFDFDVIRTTLRRLRERSEFFPSIRAIVEDLEGSGDDRANQSWATLLQAADDGGNASVKFLDPAAATATDVALGGYLQAARLLRVADEQMVAHYRKAYVQAYLTARKFPRQVETYRAGVFEFQNSGGGSWTLRMTTYTGPVRLIGLREVKEIRLPFDAQTGQLTSEARLMIEAAHTEQGARRLLEVGRTRVPQLMPAPDDEPVSHGEAMKFLKQVETKTGMNVMKIASINTETDEEYQARVQRYRAALLADSEQGGGNE
jgi:hypothetical protein